MRTLVAALVLTTCSCTSAPRVARIDSPDAGLRSQSPDDSDAGFARLGARRPGGIQRTAATFTPAEPRTPDPFATRNDPTQGGRLPDAPSAIPRGRGTTFYTAEARGPSDAPCDPSGVCPPDAPCGPGAGGPSPYGPALYGPVPLVHGPVPPMSYPRLYPDEYLCDGGDRALPVHYDDYGRLGLDTEDTVAEYVDSLGEFRMKPSTRVCIYAPRFGAMRTASGPEAGTSVDRLASAAETRIGAGFRNRDAIAYHEQRRGPDGLLVRSRPSGLDTDYIGRGAHQATVAVQHDKLLNAFEDYMFLRTGLLETGEEAWLAKGVQAAVVWTRDQNPVIAAKVTGGQEVRATFLPAEIVGIEDRRKPGALRIVKLADRKVAVPGDVITFTIRYDNLGGLPVTQVRIVDNLTPRLEYVMDSGTSDLPGEILVQDNAEGSSILTIELDDPIKGHTGGVITFQAKVR